MKQRLYWIPIIFILSAIGYIAAYYPWLTNPRSEEDIAKDWANIEAVARLPKQCKKDWTALGELYRTAKEASRFAKVGSDPFTLQKEFSSEWSKLINAENDLYYEDSDAFFTRFQEKLVGQWSQNGARAITKWKNGSSLPKRTVDVTIFDTTAEDYTSLEDYISLMSKFEQEETQRLLGELLQGFLDCGDMIETLIGIENIQALVEKTSVPIPRPSLDNERLLVIVAREYMGIHRTLEQQDFANGFLRIRPSGNGFQDYSHLPLIMRSEYRDLWAWKDSTGKRFRQFQMHVQDEDFLEQLHSINREEFHPLSSFDKVLLFSMVPLIDGMDEIQYSEP
jgi:hypothetical protein